MKRTSSNWEFYGKKNTKSGKKMETLATNPITLREVPQKAGSRPSSADVGTFSWHTEYDSTSWNNIARKKRTVSNRAFCGQPSFSSKKIEKWATDTLREVSQGAGSRLSRVEAPTFSHYTKVPGIRQSCQETDGVKSSFYDDFLIEEVSHQPDYSQKHFLKGRDSRLEGCSCNISLLYRALL